MRRSWRRPCPKDERVIAVVRVGNLGSQRGPTAPTRRQARHGTADDHVPVACDRLAEKASGSLSGDRLPGGRWNAIRLPSRSNSVGSRRAAAFITDGRIVTWL